MDASIEASRLFGNRGVARARRAPAAIASARPSLPTRKEYPSAAD